MTPTGDNSRVTMAVLSTKLDMVLAKLDRLDSSLEELDRRLNHVEHQEAAREVEIENLKESIKTVKQRDFWGSLLSSILAVIAGIVGYSK